MSTEGEAKRTSTAGLTLLALGIVYGDIGTSPLYAVKETFSPAHGIPITPETIVGGLSTIFWALMIVVSLKYVTLVLRADNRGEGGIMALVALASTAVAGSPRWTTAVFALGLLGASLFFGEAVLTPAISVLSAVEGLEVGTAAFKPYVLPITVGVLVPLFAFQRHGTQIVGTVFGPICVLWFLALTAVGVYNIGQYPLVLEALNPLHALQFVTGHGVASFIVLGAVLLAFTGVEALYADMGHFGRGPIRIAWFGLVLPALMLNYFGQGALLIREPGAIAHPFFMAFPDWALYPMVGLATAATVIASQATISGAYSMTRQAIQLGLLPRQKVVQTSASEIGQIYVPTMNWVLLAAVLAAVVGFGSSSKLASAYGVAVTGTMVVTTLLAFTVVRYGWGYPLALCLGATVTFAFVDLMFFSASLVKIPDGGWFPLAVGVVMMTLMATWRRGRSILMSSLKQSSVPLESFLEMLLVNPPNRAAGTAVFLTSAPDVVPHAMLHNLAHNKVLHQRVVFLTVNVEDIPFVPNEKRVHVEPLGHECYRILVHFGFKDRPDVPLALQSCAAHGLEFNMLATSFFLSRETVIPTRNGKGMVLWRERLFSTMARNAGSAVEFFNIPTNRVVELGTQIEI